MSVDVCIVVPMAPHGKGRGRIVRVGRFSRIATPEATRRWETEFAEHAAKLLPAEPLEGPVRVDILAVFPRPQSLMRRKDRDGFVWHTSRPDADNVAKSVLDGLKRHWRDDSQVVQCETVKVYAEKNGLPRTVVRVRTVEPDSRPDHEASALGPVAS